jgi:hypothetical protein
MAARPPRLAAAAQAACQSGRQTLDTNEKQKRGRIN